MSERNADPRNEKVMVYLPREVRRLMAVAAAERGLRISAIYEEACGAYLKARTPAASAAEPSEAPPPASRRAIREGLEETLLKRLGACQHHIMEIHAVTACLLPAIDTRALAVVIVALAKAGSEGIGTPGIRTILNASAFTGVRTSTVRDVLVQAGVARYADGRLFIEDVDPARHRV